MNVSNRAGHDEKGRAEQADAANEQRAAQPDNLR